MRNTSSMYLTQSISLLGLLSGKVSSICPMYMVASAEASLVTIARLHVCVKSKLSNLNMLFFSTYFSRWSKKTFCGCSLNTFENDWMASSWLMFVYRLSMSNVMRCECVGIFVFLRMCLNSVEFLM